ncbi:hypothetical protein LPJ72_002842 [Coemansia sp. Benny D160-2]|nr:hypothetical protein LPJ72_002842 [Coemansia sp. Benny D160-2]
MQISGKVAVVTGGTRGIGRSIVDMLVSNGANVVVSGINKSGEQVVKEINKQNNAKVAVFHMCDVSKLDEIKGLLDRAETEFGGLDILVNNAGIGDSYIWTEQDSNQLSKVIDTNLKAPIEGTRQAVELFYKSGNPGCVVNISSVLGIIPSELTAVYGATKAGLVMFTASAGPLAKGTPSIRINSVAPIFINTDMINKGAPDVITNHLRSFGERTPACVAMEVLRCIEDDSLAGETILMKQTGPGVIHEMPKAESNGFIQFICN